MFFRFSCVFLHQRDHHFSLLFYSESILTKLNVQLIVVARPQEVVINRKMQRHLTFQAKWLKATGAHIFQVSLISSNLLLPDPCLLPHNISSGSPDGLVLLIYMYMGRESTVWEHFLAKKQEMSITRFGFSNRKKCKLWVKQTKWKNTQVNLSS